MLASSFNKVTSAMSACWTHTDNEETGDVESGAGGLQDVPGAGPADRQRAGCIDSAMQKLQLPIPGLSKMQDPPVVACVVGVVATAATLGALHTALDPWSNVIVSSVAGVGCAMVASVLRVVCLNPPAQ